MAKPGPKPGFRIKEETKQKMRESMAERQELQRIGRKMGELGKILAAAMDQHRGESK